MAERNRVTPDGDVVATALRGAWMGNRGCLHEGRTIVRPWRSRAWITCELSYRGWRMPQWAPGRYTVLFFHDEAVALAAGHRPCALCRRPAFVDFARRWSESTGDPARAPVIDDRLHAERLDGRAKRTHRMPWADLPDGAFVRHDGAPALVLGDRAVPWSAERGYRAPVRRPARGDATVLTPATTLAVIAAGYAPQLDPGAQ